MMEKLTAEALKHIFDEPIYVVGGAGAIENPMAIEKNVDPEIITTAPEVQEPIAEYTLPELRGDYSSKTLVIVDYENEQYISEEDQVFLLKVLAAVNLNLTRVGILNAHAGLFEKDLDQLKPKTILTFGSFAPFETAQKYSPTKALGANLLVCHSLAEIAEAKELKISLWNALKVMFLP